jgi:hypothetical protein
MYSLTGKILRYERIEVGSNPATSTITSLSLGEGQGEEKVP